jgi:hypothetical protein
MIEWRFGAQDVAQIRFAFSPLLEAVLSSIVLRRPASHALHLPWVRIARHRLTGLDLSLLFALVPVSGITADFLSLPPSTPLPDFAEELDVLRRTPADQITADLVDVHGLPAAVPQQIRDDPTAAVEQLADTLEQYWERVLEDFWPQMRDILEGDVLRRTRRASREGAAAMFTDLHPSISWHGDRLRVTDRWTHTGPVSGDGLLLIPSVFCWPGVRKMVAPYTASLC